MNQESKEYLKFGSVALFLAYALLALNIYYFCIPLFRSFKWETPIVTEFIFKLRDAGLFTSPYKLKLWAEVIAILTHLFRIDMTTNKSWTQIIIYFVCGLVLYLLPVNNPILYILCTVAGFILLNAALAHMVRKLLPKTDDPEEEFTFPQETKLRKNKYSINIPYHFNDGKRRKKGWINVVSPFRAVAVYGTPGAGKSFSIYGHFLRQMVQKNYAMFVYDFKYPDLTLIVYNLWLKYKETYDTETEFLVINFNDARYSNRCNPIHKRYITEPADTTEIAELVMLNVNKAAVEKQDFFTESAKMYLDVIIYFLSIYEDGKYCTFPHAIEMMSQPYKEVFAILEKYPQLRSKLTAFVDAMKDNAQEQLQGQIASARIPLGRFTSPSLYWVLTGDDVDLNINDPKKPKFLCVGNDPNRQTIYGTTLALIVARMFRQVNQKGRHHCAVMLDELPTIFIKGLDNLIATARSNKVAIVVGAQDKSQLIRDYGEKEANVIFGTIGTYFSGQVKGRTAEDFSKEFGKKKRKNTSVSIGDNFSVSTSLHEEDLLPVNKIATLSQGQFFGSVADSNDQKIDKPMFFGDIYVDVKKVLAEEAAFKPIPQIATFGEQEAEEEVRADAENLLFCEVRDMEERRYEEENIEDPDENALEIATDERLSSMSESEKEKLLQKIIEEKKKYRRHEIIERKFQSVQEETHDIVEKLYAPIRESKAREKAQQDTEKKLSHLGSFVERMKNAAAQNRDSMQDGSAQAGQV